MLTADAHFFRVHALAEMAPPGLMTTPLFAPSKTPAAAQAVHRRYRDRQDSGNIHTERAGHQRSRRCQLGAR